MPHFKRYRPKDRRAGCLLCKPHKANRAKGRYCDQTVQEKKAVESEKYQKNEAQSSSG